MILTVDVGNTNIVCGVFDGEKLVAKFRMPTQVGYNIEEDLQSNLAPYEITGAILGSVVDNINDRLCCAIKNVCGVVPVVLSYQSDMPIKLKLKNNAEIGADRIANGVRGWNLYKSAVLVVDFGTAITFDIVNSKGEFIGGLIAPGIKTQFESLGKATSKLPNLNIDYVDKAIGNSTHDAILSGVVRGVGAMIDGMLEQSIKELGETPKIIATGGFCNIVAKYMTHKFDLISPDLTLEGLSDLYKCNKSA